MKYILFLIIIVLMFSCSPKVDNNNLLPTDTTSLLRVLPQIDISNLESNDKTFDKIIFIAEPSFWYKENSYMYVFDFNNELNENCSIVLKIMFEDSAQWGELEYMCWLINRDKNIQTELVVKKEKLAKLYELIKK